jgi:hypothetical protein
MFPPHCTPVLVYTPFLLAHGIENKMKMGGGGRNQQFIRIKVSRK